MSTYYLRAIMLAWTMWVVRTPTLSLTVRFHLMKKLRLCTAIKDKGNKAKLIIDFLTRYFRVLFLFAFFAVGSRHLTCLYEQLNEIQHWRQKGFISRVAVRVLLLLHHQLLTIWMIYEGVTVWLHIRFCRFSTPISKDISKKYHSSVFEQEFIALFL